jgi:hypothetical protein
MGKRILLGGVVGSIVIFLVSSVWHMVAGLGEIGVQNVPNEEAVLAVMRSSIQAPGFYFFPGLETSPGMTKEQKQAAEKKWNEKYRVGPTGILIYRPGGEDFKFGKLLTVQFGIGALAAFVVAWLLGLAAGGLPSFGARAMVVVLIAVFATVVTDLPYWNWYGFPCNYTLAHMAGAVVCWGITGLAMAAVVKRPA